MQQKIMLNVWKNYREKQLNATKFAKSFPPPQVYQVRDSIKTRFPYKCDKIAIELFLGYGYSIYINSIHIIGSRKYVTRYP